MWLQGRQHAHHTDDGHGGAAGSYKRHSEHADVGRGSRHADVTWHRVRLGTAAEKALAQRWDKAKCAERRIARYNMHTTEYAPWHIQLYAYVHVEGCGG